MPGCSSTYSRTGSSRPVSGRSASTQCGFGRNRQSKHEVDVERQAVLVAERHDVAPAAPAPRDVVGEQLAQAVAQLVHVEVRRVDDAGRPRPSATRAARARARCRRSRDRSPTAGAGGGSLRSGARARRRPRRGRGCASVTPMPLQLVERGREVVRGSRRSARRRPARSASASRCPRASSATLPMSIGGRLSMTKKPRSSSTCAASDRPAPDMPVMIVTSRPCRSSSSSSIASRRVERDASWAYTAVRDGVGQPRQRERAPPRRAPAASSPSRTPCSSRFLRVGPSPGTSSRTDLVIFLPRSWRWYVIAKRCASSRTCCSRYSASESRGMRTGSLAAGQVHLLEPLGEARDADVFEARAPRARARRR